MGKWAIYTSICWCYTAPLCPYISIRMDIFNSHSLYMLLTFVDKNYTKVICNNCQVMNQYLHQGFCQKLIGSCHETDSIVSSLMVTSNEGTSLFWLVQCFQITQTLLVLMLTTYVYLNSIFICASCMNPSTEVCVMILRLLANIICH